MENLCHVHKQQITLYCTEDKCSCGFKFGCLTCFREIKSHPEPHQGCDYVEIEGQANLQLKLSKLPLKSFQAHFLEYIKKLIKSYMDMVEKKVRKESVVISNSFFFYLLGLMQQFSDMYAPVSKVYSSFVYFSYEQLQELQVSEEVQIGLFLEIIKNKASQNFKQLVKFEKKDEEIQNLYDLSTRSINSELDLDVQMALEEQEENLEQFFKLAIRPFRYLESFYLKRSPVHGYNSLLQIGRFEYYTKINDCKSQRVNFMKQIILQTLLMEKQLKLKKQITRRDIYKEIVMCAFVGVEY